MRSAVALKYERKISAEEEKNCALLVEKSALSFFPSPGTEFVLRAGKKKTRTRVRAVYCKCVGAPHFHYWVSLKGIAKPKKGKTITVEKETKTNEFVLRA